MNKEKVQAAMDDLKVKQDLFLISKLEEEYNELSDKCNKLYTYIYSLDFITKVPDCDERCLMQEQHKRMESYRTNLYQRIDFYRCRVKTACGYDVLVPWSEAANQLQKNGILLSPQEATQKLFNLFFKAKTLVYAPSEKCAKCGGDLLYGMGAKDGDETICFNCANQITNEELQQALDEYRAACTHHCGQDAEEQHHNYRAIVEGQGIHINDGNVPLDQCGCIKICKVGGGNATVKDPNESQPADTVPESLKELVCMQIEHVFPANHKCDKCDYYTSCNRSVKKLELVGGYMLCLAPLPNSIVTE